MEHRQSSLHVAIDFSNMQEEEEEHGTVLVNSNDDDQHHQNNNGRYITPREYLDTVYKNFLLRVSPCPRKCDLLQDTFTMQLTTEDDYGRVMEVEMIRWMTCTHVLKDVLMHNYKHGNLPIYRSSDGCARIHDGDVRGVDMVGFPDSDVRMVANLVWETLVLHNYVLYNDDGSLVATGGDGNNNGAMTRDATGEKRAIIITTTTTTTREKSDKTD